MQHGGSGFLVVPESLVAHISLFNMPSQSSGSKKISFQVWEHTYTLVGHSTALSAPPPWSMGCQALGSGTFQLEDILVLSL